MEFLITYDVATETAKGRRRLHRVAKVCEGYGQRVQKSVFECTLAPEGLVTLKHRLKKEINEEEDSLRIYRLREPRDKYVEVLGRKLENDIHDPLVI